MAYLVADIQKLCVEITNASQPGSAYGAISSERYKTEEYDAAIRLADLSCARSILNNPSDGRRAAFLTSSAVAHTDIIPTHVGPIDDVWFAITGGQYAGNRGVEPWPMSKFNELEDLNRNPQGNPFIEPRCIIQGDAVFHNAAGLVAGGASAASFMVRYPVLTASAGSSIQSPDEFARAIACGALAILFQVDGQRTSAGAQFEQMYRAELAQNGVRVASPLEIPENAQTA